MSNTTCNNDETVLSYRKALDGARLLYSDLKVPDARVDELFSEVTRVDPQQLTQSDFERLMLEAVRSDPLLYVEVITALRKEDEKREEAPDLYTAKHFPKIAFLDTFARAVLRHMQSNPRDLTEHAAATHLRPPGQHENFWDECTLTFGYSVLAKYYNQLVALKEALVGSTLHQGRIDAVIARVAGRELRTLKKMHSFEQAVWDALATDWDALEYMYCTWQPKQRRKGPMSFGTHVQSSDGLWRSVPTAPETHLELLLSHIYHTQLRIHGFLPLPAHKEPL